MNKRPIIEWTELAHRVNDGVNVVLPWARGNGVDEAVISVYDTREGAYFEVNVAPRSRTRRVLPPVRVQGFRQLPGQPSRGRTPGNRRTRQSGELEA